MLDSSKRFSINWHEERLTGCMLKYLGYRMVGSLSGIIPRRVQYGVSRWISDAYYHIDGTARQNVKANLRSLFDGDTRPAEVTHTARQIFRSFGIYLCEFLGYRSYGAQFIREHVEVRGRDHLDAALRSGRGVIFCSAHYSNWELGASVVAYMGYPIVAITQMHADSSANRVFVEQREARGVRVVHSQHGAKAALRALRQNQTVAVLGDRTTGGPTVEVQFLGRRTALPQGPWRLAAISGAALLPTFVHRRSDLGYTLEIGPAIDSLKAGTREKQIVYSAQQWTHCFESRLRADPCQWAEFQRIWNEVEDTSPAGRNIGYGNTDEIPALELSSTHGGAHS